MGGAGALARRGGGRRRGSDRRAAGAVAGAGLAVGRGRPALSSSARIASVKLLEHLVGDVLDQPAAELGQDAGDVDLGGDAHLGLAAASAPPGGSLIRRSAPPRPLVSWPGGHDLRGARRRDRATRSGPCPCSGRRPGPTLTVIVPA